MRLSIGEAAGLLGVSVSTLRYYDQIGLVKASQVGENGYRYYDRPAIALLQQALFYRELGLSLKEVGPLLQAPEETRAAALRAHRELLLLKREQLDGLLRLVDDTLGGTAMTKPNVTQADIDAAKTAYAEEARARWGHTRAWKESQEKTPVPEAMEQAEEIFAAFAALRGSDPAAPEVQALVKQWQDHITASHYTCTREILAGLGQMYVGDERFAAHLDSHGPGTARLMADAIAVYCK